MVLIPQRLFTDPNVSILLRDGNNCILRKSLPAALEAREAYLSNHVVSIVLAGEQRIKTYDESVISLAAGELVFLPRGVYYVTDLTPDAGNFESLLFYFDDQTIQDFLAGSQVQNVNRNCTVDHLRYLQSPAISVFTEALLAVFGNKAMGNQFLRLKTLELLHLIEAATTTADFTRFLFRLTLPQKRNIKEFMESNYDKPLKIEDYAYLTGRSETSFCRDFKAYFNTTPQRWIKDRRIEKAVQLLKNGEMSVGQLSHEVGYDNTSYFIREFKDRVGHSPKQYMIARRRERTL